MRRHAYSHPYAHLFGHERKLLRRYESVPLVCASGNDAHQVFRPHDGYCKGLGRSVHGRDYQCPPSSVPVASTAGSSTGSSTGSLEQQGKRLDELIRMPHMLDDLRGQDKVVRIVSLRQRFGGDALVAVDQGCMQVNVVGSSAAASTWRGSEVVTKQCAHRIRRRDRGSKDA